jgi:uncharacterized protein (TIGR02265 family)
MRALEFVAPHCDIVERLHDVPPSAQVRGLYFRSFLAILRQTGRLLDYERFFPNESYSSLTYQPLGEYLLRLAVAGAVMTSPETLHDGILQLTQKNAAAFASSILGKVLLRLLARDPVRLTEQGLSARRQSTTYGEWELIRRETRCLEMVYRAEYMWIESAIAGAAMGSFEACSLRPSLETVLKDKYNGSTLIRW